jgi:hypothetical protein
MSPIRLLVAALLLASASAFAETPNVQDFRIRYRQEPGQSAAQETLRGVQRAAELQSAAGETLTHRRTLKDGRHEMRAARPMTRAEAWALAEKLQRTNPGIGTVEPIDPEADLVPGRAPTGQGGKP